MWTPLAFMAWLRKTLPGRSTAELLAAVERPEGMSRRNFLRACGATAVVVASSRIVVPRIEPEYAAYTIPGVSKIPTRMIVGEPIIVPISSPDALQDLNVYARRQSWHLEFFAWQEQGMIPPIQSRKARRNQSTKDLI